MNDDSILPIYRKINEISEAIDELATVGKRSELRKKAFKVALLLEEARKAAQEMEEEIIRLKYNYPAQRFESKGSEAG